MKTKLMTVLITAASAVGFAVDSMPTTKDVPLDIKPKLTPIKQTSNWFAYMCMGLSDSHLNTYEKVVGGLGVGCRFALPVGALDISGNYTGDNPWSEKKTYGFWTVPRVSYFYYFSPRK